VTVLPRCEDVATCVTGEDGARGFKYKFRSTWTLDPSNLDAEHVRSVAKPADIVALKELSGRRSKRASERTKGGDQ
jgi:hypothetical protein